MTSKEVDQFEKVQAQIEGLLEEISVLSKKSPNDSVNVFKLKFVNELLTISNKILGEKYKPLNSFEAFSMDDLPSNSDVTFILSQYLNCFEKLRADNIYRNKEYDGNKYFFEWYWITDKKQSSIKTAPPKKIK